VIKSFADRTREVVITGAPAPAGRASGNARSSAALLDAAVELTFLNLPPGNHLEALKGSSRTAFHQDQRPMAHLLPLDRKRRRASRDCDYH